MNDHVRGNQGAFRAMLESLLEIPIVGDVRGAGYFMALELVRDRETKATFTAEECDWLLRDFLSPDLFRRGLICRADDRGDPVVQLSPPLIAGPGDFAEIEAALRPALEEASRRLDVRLRRRRASAPRAHRGPRHPAGGGGGGAGPSRPLGPHLRARRPDTVAVGRRAAADDGHAARGARGAARLPGAARGARPRGLGFGTGFAHAERPRRRCATLPRSSASRSSRCPTRCRSSRSPRRPSRISSTRATACCSGRWPRTSGSSGSCSPSAGWTAW